MSLTKPKLGRVTSESPDPEANSERDTFSITPSPPNEEEEGYKGLGHSLPGGSSSSGGRWRRRNVSGSKSEDHFVRTGTKIVYTAGRPPWYDTQGHLQEPLVIGICGGSASGKTTVANSIIAALDVPWVTLLSLDSFYKVLNEEEHERAAANTYDFDHPNAFDFQLAAETLKRLKEGKSAKVPVYNFTTHSREKLPKTLYGADVIIFEGILSFCKDEILDLMDLKIFVDTDSDVRLARRLRRDILERARDVDGVITQYFNTVKPSFDNFIAPCMRQADIVIPRGGENKVAIDLIVKHLTKVLEERGYRRSRAYLAHRAEENVPYPRALTVLNQTPQVQGLHTLVRCRETPRDEFIFYSKRLMRILIENALSLLPFQNVTVKTPLGKDYHGKHRSAKICGVSILRAGETLEPALREVVKDCKMGKMLIQTNTWSLEPELYYLRLPKDIQSYHVFLMDATVATGAAAMMAIRVLLDHDVPQENIFVLSLLMATAGAHSIAYAFPKVHLVTTAVDPKLSENYYIIPGIGNFGDRYFGTSITERALSGGKSFDDEESEVEEEMEKNDDNTVTSSETEFWEGDSGLGCVKEDEILSED